MAMQDVTGSLPCYAMSPCCLPTVCLTNKLALASLTGLEPTALTSLMGLNDTAEAC